MGAEEFKIGGMPRDIDAYNAGYDGADISSSYKTTLPQFGQLTVNFAKENIGAKQGLNIAELLSKFDNGGAVGLGRNVFSPDSGNRLNTFS